MNYTIEGFRKITEYCNCGVLRVQVKGNETIIGVLRPVGLCTILESLKLLTVQHICELVNPIRSR